MFYTYLWLRADGTPYYAGKGKDDRGFVSRAHHVRRPKDRARIIIQEWPSEADAFEGEKLLIAFYGRKDLGTGILHNHTDGGDGPAGAKRSRETRLRMSLSQKGKPRPKASLATRLLQSQRKMGHSTPQATRDKISKSMQGRKRGPYKKTLANLP
jgi:hypothetical protein